MTKETGSGKPGWFELIDGDAPSAQVTKVNKKLPVFAVLVTGAVIATGAFFASAEEKSRAETLTAAGAATTSSSIALDPNSTTAATSTQSLPVTSAGAGVAVPGASTIQDPTQGGMAMPRGEGDDDDEFGEHEERGEGGEHRERGEHHERGEHEDRN